MSKFIIIFLVLFAIAINMSVAAANAISIFVFLFAIFHQIKHKPNYKELKTGFETYFIAFFAACLLSVIVNYNMWPDTFKSFSQIRWILIFYATFYLMSLCTQSELEKLLRVFLLILSLSGLYAFFQYLTGIEVLRPNQSLEIPRPATQLRYRAIGFFNNPMTFGHSIALAVPMAFSYMAYSLKENKSKLLYSIILFMAISVGLFSSLTRGGYLAAFFGLSLTAFLIRKRLVLFPLVSLLAIMGLSFITHSEFFVRINTIFEKTHSLMSRVEIWQAYYEMFKDHPLFGVGLDMGYKLLPHYYELIGGKDNQIGHAHNTYLQFLATGGILCFITFCLMNIKFLLSSFRGYHPKTFEHFILVGTAGSVFGFLIGGLTECNYIDSEVRFNYLFYLALLATALYRIKKLKI